eukprot:1027212-Prymnesium_polylepis.1
MGIRQRRAVTKFYQCSQLDSAEFDVKIKAIAEELMEVFDNDGSGEIDSKELREIMTAVFSFAPEDVMVKVLLDCRKFAEDGAFDD